MTMNPTANAPVNPATAAARSAAARKAAATRAARRSSGIGPIPSTRRHHGPAFSTPKPDARALLLTALASCEDALAVKLRENGITDEARKSFTTYQRLKALALGPAATPEARTEAYAALRMALLTAIKLTF